jgi:hypothetical protein
MLRARAEGKKPQLRLKRGEKGSSRVVSSYQEEKGRFAPGRPAYRSFPLQQTYPEPIASR